MFTLGIYGCGYKANPFYTKKVIDKDNDVVFIQNFKDSNGTKK